MTRSKVVANRAGPQWRSTYDAKRGVGTAVIGPVKFVTTSKHFRLYEHDHLVLEMPRTADLAVAILRLMIAIRAEVKGNYRLAGKQENMARTNAKRPKPKAKYVDDALKKVLASNTPEHKIVAVALNSAIARMKAEGIPPRKGAKEEVCETYVRKRLRLMRESSI